MDTTAIRKKLKDNLSYYSTNCLKIRTKSGSVEPFILNKAQLYIHNKLEDQLRRTGKVRALILKGRQQGCCLSPDSKVLTSDYRWVRIEDLSVGDKVVACDEASSGVTSIGRKKSRQFRTATVQHKAEFIKETIEVILDNGARLVMTLDHRMLSRQRGGAYQVWRYGADFIIGDYIRVATRPPYYESSFEDGWVGGIIDGEGSWRGNKGAKRLSLHQIDGPVLHRIKRYFDTIGIPYCEVIDRRGAGDSSKLGALPVHRIDIHRLPYLMEILARTRPTRFVDRDWHSGHELPGKAAKDGISPWAKIISIKRLGKQRVIDIQTSEQTFIAEGLVSHNSTYVGARFYHKVTHSFGTQAFILAHELNATNNLFKMAKRFYEHTPLIVRPEVATSNSKELIFGTLDSGYKLGTSENPNVGRSSTIQLLHGSEVGFWKNEAEHSVGIMQAVPNTPGSEIILESTANGVGNYFHQEWQKAEGGISEYVAIFIPWFWQEEYRHPLTDDFVLTSQEALLKEQYGINDEQILWRRMKIVELSVAGMDGDKSFKQEYPMNSTEAFQLTGEDSYIPSDAVVRARKTEIDRYGPLVVGVDPARFGDDRTAIIRRQGRCAYDLQSYVKKDTMEVVGLVHNIIIHERPAKVFVDIGGMGAGIVDRLFELGHRDIVVGVNAGSSALDNKKYLNKRAEMWGELREWLASEPCQIPDLDSLHSDLVGIRYRIDSNSRLVMEQKAEMKKRGIRSCDEADALCLTFALPVDALTVKTKHSDSKKALAATLNQHLAAREALRKR